MQSAESCRLLRSRCSGAKMTGLELKCTCRPPRKHMQAICNLLSSSKHLGFARAPGKAPCAAAEAPNPQPIGCPQGRISGESQGPGLVSHTTAAPPLPPPPPLALSLGSATRWPCPHSQPA